MKYIIKLRGWIRLFVFSVCPKCNSDAPEIDSCRVCCGIKSDDPNITWPWRDPLRKTIWFAFNYIWNHRWKDLL